MQAVSRPAPDLDPDSPAFAARRRRNRLTLIALVAVCVAPVVASYLTYYWFPPEGRTNYGELIRPQRDVAPVAVVPEVVAPPLPEQVPIEASAGQPATLGAWRGRWLMIVPTEGDCDADCRQRLIDVRQVRLTMGRERERVERIWLLAGDAQMPGSVLAEHDGIHVLRIAPQALQGAFPAAQGRAVTDHIYMVDPLGHLMMRFPHQADPSRMKKDLTRLLKASRIG